MILRTFRNTCLRKKVPLDYFILLILLRRNFWLMRILLHNEFSFYFSPTTSCWQTMAHSLNLAHCLFLYSLQRMAFTLLNVKIFFLKKERTFHDMWTLYHIWISVSTNKILFRQVDSLLYCLWLLSYYKGRAG